MPLPPIRCALVFAILFPGIAHAQVSPECIDASPASPLAIYNAVAGFKLCAPTLDANGELLSPSELETCSIEVSGVATLTQAAQPGELLVFPPVNAPGPKHGNVFATCAGPAGTSDPTPTYSALLRVGKPQKPVVVEWSK